MYQDRPRVEGNVAACPNVFFSVKNLRSMVYNLLSNAVKYRPTARPRCASAATRPHGLVLGLCAQDNGLGIRPSCHSGLSATFRRPRNHVGGADIGLYMVKRIVENVGNRIEGESPRDLGTPFAVYLPYAAAGGA